jgi:nitroreductase
MQWRGGQKTSKSSDQVRESRRRQTTLHEEAAMADGPTIVESKADQAITGRRAVRAFRPDPVPPELIRHILRVAARAPSGGNVQPWKVHVVSGAAKATLQSALHLAVQQPGYHPEDAYAYYPRHWFEPYAGRRLEIARQLHGSLGIGRRDVAAMRAQDRRNLVFFDAPVGLFFFLDRRLEVGSWLDMGMFIASVMISARSHGLDTCPQASFISHHRIVQRHLGSSEDEILCCGMALGFRDPVRPENVFETPREPLESFVAFHDDSEGGVA